MCASLKLFPKQNKYKQYLPTFFDTRYTSVRLYFLAIYLFKFIGMSFWTKHTIIYSLVYFQKDLGERQ